MRRWIENHPVATAVLLVLPAAAAGYVASALASGKLSDTLAIASTTLLFGALLGGLVKLFLEDVQRVREVRAEQVRFVRAVLADLKAVHDRTERVRTLIAAHQSALTYGNEMRDLIDSAVQLRNVVRALDQTSDILETHRSALRSSVASMESYLNSLTDEFTTSYKAIADEQRIYAAAFDELLKKPHVQAPHNSPWDSLRNLPRLDEFLGGSNSAKDSPVYTSDFLNPLDLATWILRSELTHLSTRRQLPLPDEQREIYNRLAQ